MKANLTSKQETILEKSLILFAKNGYNETSMQDIAEEVGIKPASLYNHITSKKDILLWICQKVSSRLRNQLLELKNMEGDPINRFERFIEFHIVNSMEHRYEFRIYQKYWSRLNRVERAETQQIYNDYLFFLQDLVNEFVPKTILPEFFPPHYFAQLLLEILEQIPHWMTNTTKTPTEIASEISGSFLYGFATTRK